MSSRTVVIGVDSSTQSTKAAVIDAVTGEQLAVGRAPHTVTGESGARESDPEVWWRALGDAVAAGIKESGLPARSVTGIAVAGQQHGLVVLDRSGRPLRPALLWNDTRSAPQAAALTAELGGPAAWTGRTGSVPVASITASKWRWLREHDPEAAKGAAGVRLPHDFLTERLAGVAATDPGDASGTGWYATATGAYDPGLLDLLGLDPALLPEVAPTGATRVGSLTDAAAEALGLPAGIAVAAGTGDNMSAAVGLGLGGAGLLDHPVLSLGTSGVVFAASRTRSTDPALSGFAAADGTFLPLACTLNCTLAVDKVASLLGLHREDTAPGGEAVLLPYLDGERTPDLPTASGLLTGLRHDTTPQQLLGAAYEGAAVTVLRALDTLLRACGLDPDAPEVAARPLRLIGGGAQGRAWVETVRRLSGRPLVLPSGGELVALGAAALAASAAGGGDPVALATAWGAGDTGRQLDPQERDSATWQRVTSVLDRAAEPLLGG
ncbi:xylulokinase [Streptomyces sp. OUCMDZ-4982]|uniref:xylulokinase n=1 Tax=Streptomyces sp. OUCMDZ-4982 TaxID=2973090 RepID=UPI00215D57B3|nr:xylulokinase [Streptomyces sp. OUCMDZ-4982]MCR8943361.1 xylulokinase [Streptomyces sp. OUCMDZ-4982]